MPLRSAVLSARRSGLLGLVAFLSSLSLAPASAAAQSPFEAYVTDLEHDVTRAGRSPAGIVPMLDLWRSYGDVRPAFARASLERLAADRRLSAPLRAYASQLLGRALLRSGDVDGSHRAFADLGYVSTWRVIGSFDNEGGAGFTTEADPERLRMESVDMDARFEGRERSVGWRTYPEVGHYGYVSFDAVFRPDTNVCGYAETFVTSERAQPLSLWLGAGGAVAAWWNGEEVLRDDAYRQPDPDRSVAMVGAARGVNRLLVKVCTLESTWGFFARLGDATGARATGLSFSTEGDAAAVHRGSGVARLPAAPVAAMAGLEAAAEGERATAASLEALARFLALTGADDPTELRAYQLALRAAQTGPTVERWVLAATLASARGDASRAVDAALAIDDDDPAALLAHARLRMTGPSPTEALPILEHVPASSVEGMEAAVLRSELLVSLGFEEGARRVIETAAARAEGAPRWLGLRARAAEEVDATDDAIELFTELLAVRFDEQATREVVIADAIARGDADTASRELEAYARLGDDHSRWLTRAADMWDALGRDDDAMGRYLAAMALAPDDADVRVAYGRALLRSGQTELATEALREALALRPTDADTRELLEGLEPAERIDESFAVPANELLRRVNDETGYATRILEELTVNTVFASGLGSSFHQIAWQVVDDEGARASRTYSIVFDPDVQRVTVRAAFVHRNGRVLEATDSFEQSLGEPAYRIYYDTRALVLVFPDIEPGDVVEVRYRIDDVAERNMFDDYYGDMHFLQNDVPTAAVDYVLVTPEARTFYFNEPALASLEHDTRVEDGTRVDHFHAVDVPALRTEPDMPGMTEVAPYLHVSTFRSWEDVGRWWWGLIHDQLYADEHLREVVHDLVDGVTDVRERVRRIYHWVIENTRYVGLEFGIHGFLPYRVPQIVQRGFGDCKDKASLIYTMLTEAGIDARLVLVRTRRNGAITDLPASLSVFDHAIAYVPELDLYLDGTAEFSGVGDFPDMDQGVTVLVVGPDSAELRRSPVMTPDLNRHDRSIAVTLTADGSGTVEVDETFVGPVAPWFRSQFQPVATREERLESWFRAVMPGTDVTANRFEALTDFDAPVRFHFEAAVPQLAVRDADGLRVRGTVLDDLVRSIARLDARELTLDLGTPQHYVEDRVIHLPAGFTVADLPAGGEARSEYGALVMSYSAEGRDVRVRTDFSVNRDVVASGDYAAFRAWATAADAILRQRLVVTGGAR